MPLPIFETFQCISVTFRLECKYFTLTINALPEPVKLVLQPRTHFHDLSSFPWPAPLLVLFSAGNMLSTDLHTRQEIVSLLKYMLKCPLLRIACPKHSIKGDSSHNPNLTQYSMLLCNFYCSLK